MRMSSDEFFAVNQKYFELIFIGASRPDSVNRLVEAIREMTCRVQPRLFTCEQFKTKQCQTGANIVAYPNSKCLNTVRFASTVAASLSCSVVFSPKVNYGFADGMDNMNLPVSIIFPSGSQIDKDYGMASGIDDFRRSLCNI